MKTTLPDSITSIVEAKKFLSNLYENGELFHPEDDAHEIAWICEPPTYEEEEKLNNLMDQVNSFPIFDPCEYCLENLMPPA